jgi:hypothetical protein
VVQINTKSKINLKLKNISKKYSEAWTWLA